MPDNLDKVDLVDSFKWRIYGALPCLGCFYILMFATIISLIFDYSPTGLAGESLSPIERSFLTIVIVLVSTIPMIFTIGMIKRNLIFKDRRFSISKEKIEIFVPNKPIFQIYWLQFDKVHFIRMKRAVGAADYRIYEIQFLNGSAQKTCEIDIVDFRRKTVDRIVVLLKSFSNQMDKEFMAFRKIQKGGGSYLEVLRI